MSKKNEVNEQLIANLARLAKLKFDKRSTKKIKFELKKILGFVNAISKINTDDIKPLIHLSEELNVLRNDEVRNEISQKDALRNAPKKDSDYFKVPTVLKK